MSKRVLWVTVGAMALEPIVNSLSKETGFDVEAEHFVFDNLSSFVFDQEILKKVESVKPDLILYIGPAEGPHVPQLDTFTILKGDHPVINLCMDAGCPGFWPVLKTYRERKSFDLIVNLDGNQDWPKGENDMTSLCPIDPRPYQKEVTKDIEIGFAGGDGSPERKDLISELTCAGLLVKAPRNETYGSYQDYADFMLRCKVVVNFARTGSGKAMHVKNRVQESAMAGACLVEQRGSPTKNWFKPQMDYLEYGTINELIEILRGLQKDPDEVEIYAQNLKKKQLLYSPNEFWNKVFKKVGFDA